MTVRRPFLNPFWLILSLPVYIGWRLLSALPIGPVGIAVGVAILLTACVLIPLAVRTRSMRNQDLADVFAWIGLTAMGFFSSLFVFTVLRDLILALARLLLPASQTAAWTSSSALYTLGLTALVTLVGFIIARGPPRVSEVTVPIRNLPQSLNGFSIVQVSDIHVGSTIKRGFLAGIVRRVNELKPDVIAVTGDLVDGSVPRLARHTAPLADLSARYGAFFVTGNHEYYSGERAWTDEIRRLGLCVLKNEHVVLQHNGGSLVLAGVTDYSAHHFDPAQRSDPAAALRDAPRDAGAKILLAHQPSSAAAAEKAGFDLQLSGHTHGGQFWPWNFFVRYFQPFTRGLNRLNTMLVYVNRGTGYWGPPNRFGVPSEITRIKLVPAT
jgi:predicted MPP superfamily phosphohydrolase